MQSLETMLHNYIIEHKTISRDELRKYGRYEFNKNLNVYDEATVDRSLRRLTEKGLVFPIQDKKSKYNTHYTIEKQQTLI